MQGIWLENNKLELRHDLPIPHPNNNEALIRVVLAGICGTDLQLLKGYYPFQGIPGHEFVGKVVDAPAAPQLIGQRVVGEINVGCGQCALCQAGYEKHCPQRVVLGIKNHNGAFAEYLTLPIANLHKVPEQIPNEKAIFTEPIAAAARILEQVNINPESKVLIIGAGRLGLLIAQVIKTSQCRLQVMVRHTKQRQILNQFGRFRGSGNQIACCLNSYRVFWILREVLLGVSQQDSMPSPHIRARGSRHPVLSNGDEETSLAI